MEALESLKGSNAEHPQLLGYFRSLWYSVAWEIAQLLSLQNDAPEITMEVLELLKGSNAELAPKAIKIILGQNYEDPNKVRAFKDAFSKEISAKVSRFVI